MWRCKISTQEELKKDKSSGSSDREAFLTSIIEALNHPFYVIDTADYRVLTANSFSRLKVGSYCYKERHGFDSPCHLHDIECPVDIVKKTKKPVTLEHTHRKKDGSLRHEQVHTYPILDDQGNVARLIVYILDVTEQKEFFAEANRLANVVRQATDSIVITDVDGCITYVNPAFEKLTGYTFAEVKGENPRILRSDKANYPEEYYKELWQAITTGKTWKGEFLNKKKNGENFIEEASIFPVRDQRSGEITAFGAVKKDITLERELEQKLLTSYREVVSLKEKAESANRLKSQFLANMSHDIRTPLHGVLGYADLLLKQAGLPGSSREYVDKIIKSGEGLLKLLNDILDFSKIEAGQLDIFPQTFPLKEITGHIKTLFELQFQQKKLAFEIKIDSRAPLNIHNDKWRIQQVLVNLLANALKFTDTGKISLVVDYSREDDFLLFRVKDSGAGIEPEDLHRVFNPVSQVQPGSGAGEKGAGLGLAICKNLSSLLGGSIEVKSEPNEGSEFTVAIPADSGRIEAGESPDVSEKNEVPMDDSWKDKKILLVEDNEVNLELMCDQFRATGFDSLLLARNGREAVDIALEHSPDLILMDIQMPVMNGREAIEELRKKGYKRPIIALTAYSMREEIEKCLSAGATTYMTKPINFNDFFNQIPKLFTLKAAGSGSIKMSANKITGSVSPRVREIFIKDVKEKVATMEAALAKEDMEADADVLKRIVHTFKGNARYLGLMNLESVAIDLDPLLKAADSMTRLRDELQDFVVLLKDILEVNPAEQGTG